MSDNCGFSSSECAGLIRIESKIDKLIDVQQDMNVKIALMQKDIEINTKDLTDHKEGVIQCRKRIDVLETPSKAAGYISKVAGWVLAVGTALAAIVGIAIKFKLVAA